MNQFIVAEVSKNWTGQWVGPLPSPSDILCGRFEQVIEHNRKRGYRLHSWNIHRLMVDKDSLNETIIAVFEKEPADA